MQNDMERGKMYCRKCGNEMPKDVNFCPKCGNPAGKKENAESMSDAGASGGYSKRKKWVAGITAVVFLVVIAVVGILFVPEIIGDKGQVDRTETAEKSGQNTESAQEKREDEAEEKPGQTGDETKDESAED